jgi:hypothetical protein
VYYSNIVYTPTHPVNGRYDFSKTISINFVCILKELKEVSIDGISGF